MAGQASVTDLCLRVGQELERFGERWLAETSGISLAQAHLLWALADAQEAVHQQRLADMLQRSKGNVTGLLQRLEQKGLVRRRQSSEDGRLITVQLTDTGRSVAKQSARLLEVQEHVASALNEVQRASVLEGLALLELALQRLQHGDAVTGGGEWAVRAAESSAVPGAGDGAQFLPQRYLNQEARQGEALVLTFEADPERPVALDQAAAVLPQATWEAAREAVWMRHHVWTGEEGTLHSREARDAKRGQGGEARDPRAEKKIDLALHRRTRRKKPRR